MTTTGPVLMQEYSEGCTCPPGPSLACSTVGHGLLMDPGAQVQIRLINHLDLDNAMLQGTLIIQNTSNSGACCDPSNGTCSVQTLTDCALAGGVYAGGSTDCTDTDGDRIHDAFELGNCANTAPCFAGSNPFIADTDGDGLLDGDEFYGTLDGLDLPAMGADPCHQDILIETDWVWTEPQDPDRNKLHVNQVTRLVTAFANSGVGNPNGVPGIKVHIDYGQAPYVGGNSVEDGDGVIDASGGLRAEFLTIKAANFAANRHGYFHYCLMADAFGIAGSPGIGERPGDDFLVSLGQLDVIGDDNRIGHIFIGDHGWKSPGSQLRLQAVQATAQVNMNG